MLFINAKGAVLYLKLNSDFMKLKQKKSLLSKRDFFYDVSYLFIASATATATATVAPTIGLLPIPRKPIIST